MKLIRSRIIAVVAVAVIFTAGVLTGISIFSINTLDERDSDEILEHMGGENAAKIDRTLEDIKHSVDNVYYYAYDQLGELFGKLYGATFRTEYLEKVGALALSEAKNSDRVEDFYFRLTTDIKEAPFGFFYQRNAQEEDFGFKQVEMTDISKYDKNDVEHVGWYYLPKEAKEPIWIGPYMNENLGFRMISYVEPIFIYGRFAGVVGMDVNVEKLCKELQQITVYDTGTAVLFDMDENILYHKDYEDGLDKEEFNTETDALSTAMHDSLKSGSPVRYISDAGEMKLYACKLMNGMTLCITAPIEEISATQWTVIQSAVPSVILLLTVTLVVTFFVINRFLRPLKELTTASRQLAEGNLDVHLQYTGDDEIGLLAKTFDLMASSLKRYFNHFHSLAYTDVLTGLNNKAAYTMTKEVIESEVKMGRASFAIIVMDVNNLKMINDSLGHERGDELLKHVTLCLRKAFVGFPLYRIGGDEFCAIINNADPQELIANLQRITALQSKEDMSLFQCSYQIAAGAAAYDREMDQSFDDVFNRADQKMYENKKYLKSKEEI